MEWYMKVLRQYADFSGRARRKEFWMYALINIIIYVVVMGIMAVVGGFNPDSSLAITLMAIYGIYALAIFIPSLAVMVRRLHDTGRSGWWWFISLVPFIGNIVLIVFWVQDSDPGTNEYGENPKGVEVTKQRI